MIRAFIGVELPQQVRQEVARFQEELKKSGADVNWTEPDNLHLTLKFLGSVEEEKLPFLKEGLRAAAAAQSSFTFLLEGVGAFPKAASPRVIWCGVSEGRESLTELANAVEQACAGLGFPSEGRPFSAHLTIGRVRSGERLPRLVKALGAAWFRAGAPAPAEGVTLFQSTLSLHGPIYTSLVQIRLRNARLT